MRASKKWSLVEKLEYHGWTVNEDGCWLFNGRLNRDGYGALKHEGRYEGAHRWAYRAWVGAIPRSLVVRHKCDARACINPEHLELGTQAENIEDAVSRSRQRTRRNLTWDDVCVIRARVAAGERQTVVASDFNADSSQISRIVNNKLYRKQYNY